MKQAIESNESTNRSRRFKISSDFIFEVRAAFAVRCFASVTTCNITHSMFVCDVAISACGLTSIPSSITKLVNLEELVLSRMTIALASLFFVSRCSLSSLAFCIQAMKSRQFPIRSLI
jgi:hypothetical protein